MKFHTPRFVLTGSLIAGCMVAGYGCGSDSTRSYGGNEKTDAASGGGSGGSTSGNGGSDTGGGSGNGGGATGGAGTGGGATGGSAGLDGGGSDAPACTSNSQCDDGNPCNGSETCSVGHCRSGTEASPGTSCTPYLSDGGSISTDGGVAYVCNAGKCVVSCTSDSECDDGNVCTGNESCSPTAHVCQQGTPLACDDGDACTDNKCDAIRGCYYPLTDADGDGHAAETLGACGDDCNDADETIFKGASELCDGKDNNCNGSTDETAPYWYADCDGDGFAATGAASTQQCAAPTAAPVSCNGAAKATWTSVPPAAGTTDCWDKNANAHPRTASDNDTSWSATAISGAPVSIDYDYNCDGTEEKRYTGTGVSTTASCSYLCGGGIYCFCSGPAGYTAGSAPACGSSAQYTYCNFAGCSRTTTSQQQECR